MLKTGLLHICKWVDKCDKDNTKPFWPRHSHVRRLQMQACILRRNKQLACNSFEPDNLVISVLKPWVFIATDIACVCEITVHTDIASVCEITLHYAIDFFVIMYFCKLCMLDPSKKIATLSDAIACNHILIKLISLIYRNQITL